LKLQQIVYCSLLGSGFGLTVLLFKGRVQCFSMQVVMNKSFLLSPEKIFGAGPSCRFREKRKKLAL